jgi:flavin reductase (DIM6/NTAB) family NADH-FMN oxidoreductase RutF
MHVKTEPTILYFGTPVALLSTVNEDGSANLAPMSSVFWLGWHCMLGLQGSSKTTENLRRTRQIVINLPSVDQVAAVDRLAKTTGSNPVPADKLERLCAGVILIIQDRVGASILNLTAPVGCRTCSGTRGRLGRSYRAADWLRG